MAIEKKEGKHTLAPTLTQLKDVCLCRCMLKQAPHNQPITVLVYSCVGQLNVR